MVRGIIRVVSLASVSLTSSGFFLYGTGHWDPSDFGVVRIGRAVLTTAAITWDYLTELRHVKAGTEEYESIKSQVHFRSAHRLLDLCCANRGTFIKVGQHLGALEYLVPPEYTKTLSVLHSQAPCTPFPDVVQVIREDLGKEISEVFVEFEEKPLGAASLAQVHRAVLQDGRKVAVKVQHPKVQAQSARDILLMEVLLHAVKKIFPQFEFMWLIEEAKKNLPLELDFENEGRNAEKMSAIVSSFSFLRIPRIYWELSTKRVLVMEYMEGGQVNDREYMKRNQIDINQVARALGQLYSEMIFVHGFVHCDPHPGNVLVRQNPETLVPEIILLDHGLYQALEIRSNAATYLPEISQLLASVPRQMLLLLKTNDLLRGIETSLGTHASSSSFLNMSRCCVRALARHRKEKTDSLWSYIHISLAETFSLGQLQIYEIVLRLQASCVGCWIRRMMQWVFLYIH
ncbi:aarF domain-containing protein kinase 1 isoform X2 [Xenopus tropicalis]|uniref:AarF domain-containing protein kinase 1 n=1 Tax=Xenopus tropicalis TaxID=8364 RepID=A0A8J1IND0_XENTR|nr:aarF domain-containing protein kinase 1 isoform X2 [Xenopus tropicalis]